MQAFACLSHLALGWAKRKRGDRAASELASVLLLFLVLPTLSEAAAYFVRTGVGRLKRLADGIDALENVRAGLEIIVCEGTIDGVSGCWNHVQASLMSSLSFLTNAGWLAGMLSDTKNSPGSRSVFSKSNSAGETSRSS